MKISFKSITKNQYFKVFSIAFLVSFFIFFITSFLSDGILLMTNDFKTQQIPFYILSKEALQNNSTISWITGLGTPVVGSYSFYTYWSPFFRLVSWLPSMALPYLMSLLLALKFGVAAITSYAYFKRYLRADDIALMCALMYAFSGFQVFNIFYNHFHDAVAFFPLMLIAMDELVENQRKGYFAFVVALMMYTNYVFFVGEVIFCVLYYFVKIITRSYKFTLKSFLHLFLEGVLGVFAGAILLPAVLFITGNSRLEDKLEGMDMLFYEPTKYLEIIRGLLFPADSPLMDSFYIKNSTSRWTSNYAYIPVFSLAGVFAFVAKRPKHFASILSITSLIMMFVPILNSAYSGFTSFYTARWLYMPIMMMTLATGYVLDNRREMQAAFDRSAIYTIIVTVCVALFAGIVYPVASSENIVTMAFFQYIDVVFLIIYTFIAVACLIIIKRWINHEKFKNLIYYSKYLVIFVCFLNLMIVTLANSITNYDANKKYLKEYVYSQDTFDDLKEENLFRFDTTKIHHNAHMWWDIPSMATFNSNISQSEVDFYNAIGIKRFVYSDISDVYYPLRGLLSVKYAVYNDDMVEFLSWEKSTLPVRGFFYLDNRHSYKVYENEFYVPMGFTYDYYISKSDFLKIEGNITRSLMLMKAIVLEDEVAENAESFTSLKKFDLENDLDEVNSYNYFSDCTQRAETSCTSFVATNTGFEATWQGEEDNLVFFSVPYNDGYKAYINGEEVPIYKVQIGFMAVEAKAGEVNNIEFIYTPPYQNITSIISVCAFGIILLLVVFDIIKTKKDKRFW